MVRLRLPSGLLVDVGFKHTRVFQGEVEKAATGLFVTLVGQAEDRSEDRQLGGTASLGAGDRFCYYLGRYYALRNLFAWDKTQAEAAKTPRLFNSSDRIMLMHFFALKKFLPGNDKAARKARAEQRVALDQRRLHFPKSPIASS